jgi:hypothetical protein
MGLGSRGKVEALVGLQHQALDLCALVLLTLRLVPQLHCYGRRHWHLRTQKASVGNAAHFVAFAGKVIGIATS